MERRAKERRLDSLKELRARRNQSETTANDGSDNDAPIYDGVDEDSVLEPTDTTATSLNNSSSSSCDASEAEESVESKSLKRKKNTKKGDVAPLITRKAKQARLAHQRGTSIISAINNQARRHGNRNDLEAVNNDAFFQSILSKFDDDDDEEEEELPMLADDIEDKTLSESVASNEEASEQESTPDAILKSLVEAVGIEMDEPSTLNSSHEINNDPESLDLDFDFDLEDAAAADAVMQDVSVNDEPADEAPMLEGLMAEDIPDSGKRLKDAKAEDIVRFYFLDAYEAANGRVVLFGKVPDPHVPNSFLSASVMIFNLSRNLFFLPERSDDEEVALQLLEQNISDRLSKANIKQFIMKRVQRNYAFEVAGVPRDGLHTFVKVSIPFSYANIPFSASAGQGYSHCFGSNVNALETLLIKRRIMGPSWLHFVPTNSTERTNISWCSMEYTLASFKDIAPMHGSEVPCIPPLRVLSLSICTQMVRAADSSSTGKKNVLMPEIVAANAVFYEGVSQDDGAPIAVKGGSTVGNKELALKLVNHCSASVTFVQSASFGQKFIDTLQNAFSQTGSKTGAMPNRTLHVLKSERLLLSKLLSCWMAWDADVIIGHDLLSFDVNLLLRRLKHHNVEDWSRLGRAKLSHIPRPRAATSSGNASVISEASRGEREAFSGRLVLDTFQGAREHVKSVNYALETLLQSQLNMTARSDALDRRQIPSQIMEDCAGVLSLIKFAESDSRLQMHLACKLQLLPLTKQLTNIAGNLWSHTLTGARSERNEFLLLHEFHKLKYIVPDRRDANRHYQLTAPDAEQQQQPEEDGEGNNGSSSKRHKPRYVGGLVLEPKKGLYTDLVMVLDFNSLYPSIIQEFNICFTTVDPHAAASDGMMETLAVDLNATAGGNGSGVLPRLLANLVQRRRQVKDLMKRLASNSKGSGANLDQLNIRQQALKLTANSMYGCLGFVHSRFYAPQLAQLVTAKGREILQSTVDLAGEMSEYRMDVIYGDTDSLFVNTHTRNVQMVYEMASALKSRVNGRFRLLEIELDAVFERLLLLKKKKYAGVPLRSEKAIAMGEKVRPEVKGLDLVRRDWSPICQSVSWKILDIILDVNGDASQAASIEDSSKMEDFKQPLSVTERIHRVLEEYGNSSSDAFSLDQFVISRNLTKDPSQYPDARTQAHVMVALAMRSRSQTVSAGDTIPFVICTEQSCRSTMTTASVNNNEGSMSLAERARHPDDVRQSNGALVVDWQWYLSQQILPCVTRLCEHLEGLTIADVAASLCLDFTKYSRPSSNGSRLSSAGGHNKLFIFMTSSEKFAHCRELEHVCQHCKQNVTITAQLIKSASTKGTSSACIACPHCQGQVNFGNLQYSLLKAVREDIARYYTHEYYCEECNGRSVQSGVYPHRCVLMRAVSSKANSATTMCNARLDATSWCFDGARLYRQLLYYEHVFSFATESNAELAQLKALARDFVQQSAYPVIHLSQLFSFYSS